jgi:hypothetical protein
VLRHTAPWHKQLCTLALWHTHPCIAALWHGTRAPSHFGTAPVHPCTLAPVHPFGPIAQRSEPPAHNRPVPGSNPGGPTILRSPFGELRTASHAPAWRVPTKRVSITRRMSTVARRGEGGPRSRGNSALKRADTSQFLQSRPSVSRIPHDRSLAAHNAGRMQRGPRHRLSCFAGRLGTGLWRGRHRAIRRRGRALVRGAP